MTPYASAPSYRLQRAPDRRGAQRARLAAVVTLTVDGKLVDKTALRCSTYSLSVGCYREEDFAKDKTLAAEDGSCRKSVPYPLPVLTAGK